MLSPHDSLPISAQARARRDEDLVGFLAALVVDRLQLLDPRQASLALGAAALGVAARPLEFLLDCLLARLLLRVLALEAVVLLHQPVGVVALPRDASAAEIGRPHVCTPVNNAHIVCSI